jgi:integrase
MVIDKQYSKRFKREMWGYDGRVDGTRKRDRRFYTRKAAEEAVASLVVNSVSEDYGLASKKKTTLGEAYNAYKEKYDKRGLHKDEDYKKGMLVTFRMLERFVDYMGGDKTPVRVVNEKKLMEWAEWMDKTPTTLGVYARRLSGMLTLARDRFSDLHNWKAPSVKTYAPGSSGTRERIISREEAFKLVGALLTTKRLRKESERDMREAADGFRIALATGMRWKEIFRLNFTALREKSSQIYIGKTKTGYDRIIPLPPVVIEIVEQRKRDKLTADFNVFPRFFTEPSFYHNIRRALLAGSSAAGLQYGRYGDGFTLHDARATYITNLLKGDRERGIRPVSIGTAMKLSGHKTLSAFQKYVRMIDEDIQDAILMSQSLAAFNMTTKGKVA